MEVVDGCDVRELKGQLDTNEGVKRPFLVKMSQKRSESSMTSDDTSSSSSS